MKILDQEKMERIKALLKTHPRGLSITNLSSITGMNRNLIAKYLDMLVISGQVEIQQYGPAKVYFLSQRVPVTAMIEITSDLVMVLDQERKIVQVNKPLTKFLAIPREDLVGKTPGEVGHPFLSSIPLPEPSEPLDSDSGEISEITNPDDGGTCYFRIKRAPTVFEDGAVGLTLIMENITEQRSYQENLRLSEARYRGIVQDQTEFITRFLPDTTLTFVNHALCLYTNRSPEELVGKRFIEMIPEEERQEVLQNIGSLTPQNPTAMVEHRMADGRGQLRWLHWTNRAIFDGTGTLQEYQGMGRDFTDQKETAERISRYILQLEFISRKAMEFVHSTPDDDLYLIIAQGVKSLYPDALVCVHSYDRNTGGMKVEVVLDKETRDRIREILGKDPVGILIQPTEEIRNKTMSGTIHRIPSDTYINCFSPFSVEELAHLQDTMGTADTYLMGLTFRNELFGEVFLILREGTMLQHQHLLETYLNQASVAVQRRIFQKELRKSREQYRRIIETASEGIWVLDRDYRTTFVNSRLAEMLGYAPEELVGRQVEEFMEPEDIPAHHQRMLERRTGVSGRFEQRFRRKDGSLIWAMASATPIMEKGEFAGAFAMLTDITDQKRAEDALRESEGKYRTLVEQADDGIVLVQDGVIKFCNRRVAEMWGGDVQDIVGQPYENFIDPGDLPRVRENYERRMAGEEVSQLYDTLLVKRDGDSIHADLNAGAIIYEGRPADLIVVHDITEKKKAEEELRRTHALQETILNASPVGIGYATKEIIAWENDAMCRMLGYNRGELKGQTGRILYADEEEYERSSRELSKGIKRGGSAEVETIWKRKDGSLLDIHLNMAEIQPGSQDVIVMATDITARKKAEEELKKTQALQQAILNASPVGIGLATNQLLTWANHTMDRMMGYEPGELKGQMSHILFADKEEYKRATQELYRGIEQRGLGEVETVWKRKDGSRMDISLTISRVRPGSPEIVAIAQDITERKGAAEELKKTQAFQQAILSASPVGIGVATNRILTWANDAMFRILGYERGELEGKTTRVLFADEAEYERATQEIYPRVDQQGSSELETVFLRKDGSRADVSVWVAQIRPGSSETIAIVKDITLRKEAERRLRESEETFRTMVSISPLPLSLIDETGKYLYVNPIFTQVFGYTLEDIPDGKAWFAQAFPDEKARETAIRLWKDDAKEHSDGEVRPRTFQVRCKDGGFKEILFLPASTPAGLQVVVYQDLTRENMQGRLRDSEDQYRHLVDDLDIGIYRSSGDLSGRFIWGNTGLISILGYESLADLKGVPVRDLFIKPKKRETLIEELRDKKFVKNRHLTLRKKDGTPVTVSVTALAEFDEKGKIQFINGLVQEVTDKGAPDS